MDISLTLKRSKARHINKFRLIFQSILFFLGLFFFDRFLYFYGNKLAASPYWHSEICNRVTYSENMDVLIVGGCRAALHFSSDIIQGITNLKTFNAGKPAIKIANMEFILASALTYQKPKYVLIVIDPNNMEESFDAAREDLIKSLPWFPKLNADEKDKLILKYHLNGLIYKTGLFSFMGKGDELIRASLRKFTKQDIIFYDGYEPRDQKHNFENMLLNTNEYENIVSQSKRKLNPSKFSIETYSRMIDLVKKNGAEPIIVVTPMHNLYSTNELNGKVKEFISTIAKNESVQLFYYLDSGSSISNIDALWSDQGHLNQLGAELFSKSFSNDFYHYIQNTNHLMNTVNLDEN